MGEEQGRVEEVEGRERDVDSPQSTIGSGVTGDTDKGKGPESAVEDRDASPAQQVAALESEIEETRKKLGGYVSELDRRRHAILSTAPRRAGAIAAAGGVLALGTVLLILRNRRRRSAAGRARRFAEAIARLARDKTRRTSSREKSPGRKILVAAAAAAAAQIARRLSARALAGSSKR